MYNNTCLLKKYRDSSEKSLPKFMMGYDRKGSIYNAIISLQVWQKVTFFLNGVMTKLSVFIPIHHFSKLILC